MRKRSMQEVSISDVFPTRKKRVLQGKTPTKLTRQSQGGFTQLKVGYNLSQSANSSDSGPEIIWDNNSPSPAKEYTRATRRTKSVRGVKDLLEKIRSSKKATGENKDPKDHSLFDVWMQAGTEVTKALNNHSEVLSPESEGKKERKGKYKGKTPRRFVGRQRSRINTIDPEFQDELCKLVMALSESKTDDPFYEQRKDLKSSSTNVKDGIGLDADIFKEDIEPLEFLDLQPEESIGIPEKIKSETHESAAVADQDLITDLFSDDDFDADVLKGTKEESFDKDQSRKDEEISRQKAGHSAATINPVFTKKDATWHTSSYAVHSHDVEKNEFATIDDDLFGDEDEDLHFAIQDLEETKSNSGVVTRQTSKTFIKTAIVTKPPSDYRCRGTSNQNAKRQHSNSNSDSGRTSSKAFISSKHGMSEQNIPNPASRTNVHPEAINQSRNNRYSSLSSSVTSSKENVLNLRSSGLQNAPGVHKQPFPPLLEDTPEEDELFASLPLDDLPMCSTQKCNESQIQEKKRIALERLAKKQRKGAGCSSDILNMKTRQR